MNKEQYFIIAVGEPIDSILVTNKPSFPIGKDYNVEAFSIDDKIKYTEDINLPPFIRMQNRLAEITFDSKIHPGSVKWDIDKGIYNQFHPTRNEDMGEY